MDALDKKILAELMKNSRTPTTVLAKRIRASREVINYRMERMIKEGIILKFVTEINTRLLGYAASSAFINMTALKEEEFKKFITECDFTSWSGSFSGVWRFGMDIYGRSTEDIDSNFNIIYKKFKNNILSHRLTLYKKNHFMHEKYIGTTRLPEKIKKSINIKIDSKDKKILEILADNSRTDTVKISLTINLTAPAVAKRIKKLESAGYINRYTVFIDISKLGLFQYSVFITNTNLEERNKLISFLKEHKSVVFIAEYIGDPFIEFGLCVKDPYILRPILQEIEESFPDNRLQDIFLIQNEFLSIGPPKCVFK